MSPKEQSYSPKKYSPDNLLKSQIVYESLCDNYGISVVEGVLKWLLISKDELFDESLVQRVLNILNGDTK